MSAWLSALREACAEQGQAAVARAVGYSPATVSQVLSGTYKGDLKRIQAAVEGALMQRTVACPVLGDIPRHHCIASQRSPLIPTNPLRVRLWRACRGCMHNTNEEV